MRIARIANFVTPVSGGLRTTLDELGASYLAAGHEPVPVVPGPAGRDEQTGSWARAAVRNLVRVPLGVDLGTFSPGRFVAAVRARLARPGELLLVHCGRLSREKRADRSIRALAELRRRGLPAVPAVAGDGPLLGTLRARATGLPVRFLGHISERDVPARPLASAGVALAPGPVGTFGPAALEALASGTPVVVSHDSTLPEVAGPAGAAVDDDPAACATAILDLLGSRSRAAERARAERYPWSAAVQGFLRAHALIGKPASPR
ncbi:glycosyl transferase [[Actinomadura] parvosata subsp. kistnae]|uniref:glycosyltransferase n=1 Tax=[Actinomadura] parvosata TaxID=1955412 RepID=UPI0009AEAF9E|nr:glycosyltransferase [Nonomuraea sp. ATCC 55076]SPL88572.1 glycosyl transferase [Actinomadura parvosata subsp. kistnae]